jgi:hypothetical protein
MDNPQDPDRLAWHSTAKRYLERLGMAESREQLARHIKTGRAKSTFRYCPSDYHRELIDCLNRNEEGRFKALKLEQGYSSAVAA